MIWLVGSRGMLGSDVENVLKEEEFDLIATDIEVDITDYNELKRFSKEHRIEWIINCSAYTAVDRAEEESEKAFKMNADGVLNLAMIAHEKGAKLVHLSTDYVFDGRKEGEYKEDDSPNPTGVYGKSKREGERHILRTLKNYFIIRTAWLYGKHGNNFVYTMLRLFKKKSSIKVVNDQWGSPTYAKDLARAVVKIIETSGNQYGIYHYTNEGRITWYQFAWEIYKKAKEYRLVEREVDILPVTTDEYPTKAQRPKNSYMSKKKIKDTFRLNIREYKEALDEFLKEISGLIQRIVRWEEYSRFDFDTANDLYEKKKYIYVLFFCQQSIEKYLKSLIEYYTIPKRTHNLRVLLERVGINDYSDYEDFFDLLNLYYLESRYASDIQKLIRSTSRKKAFESIRLTEEVLKWLKQKKKPFLL